MKRRLFDTFADFAQALQEAGVEHIVERVIQEIRPHPGEGTSVIVEQVHYLEFLAYRDGVVLACTVEGGARAECERWLAEQGIQVKKVSGNIT